MEQFSLDKWFENPNRKVVTRDGRSVRIICSDRQCELEYNYPVIALVSVENKEVPVISNEEGKTWNNSEINSLFFADEGDELTEFEKEYKKLYTEGYADGQAGSNPLSDKVLKECATELLNLARKELKKDWRTPLRLYKRGYEQGKKDALKSIPKLTKTKPSETTPYVSVNNWYMTVEDFLNLPKEE